MARVIPCEGYCDYENKTQRKEGWRRTTTIMSKMTREQRELQFVHTTLLLWQRNWHGKARVKWCVTWGIESFVEEDHNLMGWHRVDWQFITKLRGQIPTSISQYSEKSGAQSSSEMLQIKASRARRFCSSNQTIIMFWNSRIVDEGFIQIIK